MFKPDNEYIAQQEVGVLQYLAAGRPESVIELLAWFFDDGHACLVFPLLGPPLQCLTCAAEGSSVCAASAAEQVEPPADGKEGGRREGGGEGESAGRIGDGMSSDALHYCSWYNEMKGEESMTCIRKISFQLVQALAYLEERSVIHADIKPDNILLQPVSVCGDDVLLTSKVTLVDFSNALFFDERHNYYDDFELQSLPYRAPEVAAGVEFGHGVDVWSLGVTIVEVWKGVSPLFNSTTREELLHEMWTLLGAPHREGLFKNGMYASSVPDYSHSPSDCDEYTARLGKISKLLGVTDRHFVDFILDMLTLDPQRRPSAVQLLAHPFFKPLSAAPYLISRAAAAGREVRLRRDRQAQESTQLKIATFRRKIAKSLSLPASPISASPQSAAVRTGERVRLHRGQGGPAAGGGRGGAGEVRWQARDGKGSDDAESHAVLLLKRRRRDEGHDVGHPRVKDEEEEGGEKGEGRSGDWVKAGRGGGNGGEEERVRGGERQNESETKVETHSRSVKLDSGEDDVRWKSPASNDGGKSKQQAGKKRISLKDMGKAGKRRTAEDQQ